MSIAQPVSEMEWQARYDAESLAKAEEISADPLRLSAAQAAAVKIAEERKKEAVAINRVASRANRRESARKTPAKAVIVPKNKPKTAKKAKNGFNVFQKI